MILFDSDTLTHHSYSNENVRRKLEKVADNEVVGISIITRNEVLLGRAESIVKSANETELRTAYERFQATEALLSDFVLIGFDDNSLRFFGSLRKQKHLKIMGRKDMLISCIALAHDALLVTRNTKDFKAVSDLRIENWVD